MSKSRLAYECTSCGARANKWLGRCVDCGQWNSMVEVVEAPSSARKTTSAAAYAPGRPTPITELPEPTAEGRWSTGMAELDRVLGGGLLPGAIVLLGGEPGVGKSTLLLQMATALARAGRRVLYASGEESLHQIQQRAKRLDSLEGNLFLQAETNVSQVLIGADQIDPAVIIVDSVQTSHCPDLPSAPGSVSQVREVCAAMVTHGKRHARAVVLVGHVTKEGQLAGPRALEHLVDTVIYFESDAQPPLRVLRAEKNRFGASGELAIFEMAGDGLHEVAEPSAVFLRDRPSDRAGTVVTAAMEGTRAVLLEVQALVAPGFPGSLRRTAVGYDAPRLHMLAAVLGRADVPIHDKDVFINVAGGLRIDEPAADLAVALAIVGSLRRKPAPADCVVLGEVGLTGEVRPTPRLDQRLAEAARHGFKRAWVPRSRRAVEAPPGLHIEVVGTIEQAIDLMLEG